MTPERREVAGAVVVAGLALTAVGITGFALATFIAEGFSGRRAAVPPGGDQEAATSGRLLFRQFCARCHGVQAQGRTVAPPLANVGLGREDVEVAVREGIPPLMPAFGKRLRADQIQAVAEYVASLSGGAGPVRMRNEAPPRAACGSPAGTDRQRLRAASCSGGSARPATGPRHKAGGPRRRWRTSGSAGKRSWRRCARAFRR
jgi:mono/diheme cytochrome c family protein